MNNPNLKSNSSNLPQADEQATAPATVSNKRRGLGRRVIWIAALILLLIGGAVAANVVAEKFKVDPNKDLLTFVVKKKTLRDTVVERGTLESQETVLGKCEVPGHEHKIVFIVPEGSVVKKGDEVVKFSSDSIDKLIAEKKIEVNEAERKLETAQQEIKVKENESASLVSDAEFALTQAEIALEKYREGDYQQQVAELERSINEGEAELERSVDQLQNFRALVKKGIRSPEQLRNIELQVKSHRHRVVRDRRQLEVLTKYTYKEEITQREHNVKDGRLKLERAKTTAIAQKSQAETEVTRAEQNLALQKEELKEKEDAKDKCTILAPQPGTVAYANEYWYSDDRKIREGAEVHEGQSIFNLPDMSRMQVKVSVHESVVNKIKKDQKASILIDAFPDHKFKGQVKIVSQLSDSSRYRATQNYEVIVPILEIPEGVALKPGMTAEVEVKVGVYKDVLAIPVTTVTENYGQSYVFRKSGDDYLKHRIEIGRVTNSFIEVTDGLTVGDELAMDAYQRGLLEFGDSDDDETNEVKTEAPSEGPQ